MKKIDLKLVVTDENGKDNTLSLFVPIVQGQDKKECKDFLDAVSVFINGQLKKEENELRDGFFSYGTAFTHNVPLTNKEATHLATTLLDTLAIEYGVIPIPIKAENMHAKEGEILIYKKDNSSCLNYTNQSLDIEGENIYKAIKIKSTIKKYINLSQGYSQWDGVYITQSAMEYIKCIFNLTNKTFQAEIFSYFLEGAQEAVKANINNEYELCVPIDELAELLTVDIMDNNKLKLIPMLFPFEFITQNIDVSDMLYIRDENLFPEANSEYPLLIRKNQISFLKSFNGIDISKITFHTVSVRDKATDDTTDELIKNITPFPIVVELGYVKTKTAFIVAPSPSGENACVHTFGDYSLCLSGLKFVSEQINRQAIFFKIVSINDNINTYLDIDKEKLYLEDLYISEQSVIKIMERFDLSYTEFSQKVLAYGGHYCLEEILEKEIKNPDLKSHQLEDIKKILATAR